MRRSCTLRTGQKKDKKMIYMDHAATSLGKPDCVAESVKAAILTLGNPGRGAHAASLAASRMVYTARKRLASFFHMEDAPDTAAADRVIFTANATESLNVAIKGMLNPGEHVITTEMEHNSVLRPLYEMEKTGVELTILSCDEKGRITCAQIEQAIRKNTRAVICTHASNVTGNVNNIQEIGLLCRKYNLHFILDASQTAGVLDIDMTACGISVLCFTGHKGLLGPQGTGGMCLAPGVFVRGMKSGGSGVHSFETAHPQKLPTALEAGTLNGHGIAGLSAAVDFISHNGIQNIREKEWRLAVTFYRGIKKIPGIRILGDTQSFENDEKNGEAAHVSIVSFTIAGIDSGEICDRLLEEYGIEVRAGVHCAPLIHQRLCTAGQGAVRFSFSYSNTEDEVEQAAAAVREIAASYRGKVISYVGAGGKTGSLLKEAHAFADSGKKVLIATTTKMACREIKAYPYVEASGVAEKEIIYEINTIFHNDNICVAGSKDVEDMENGEQKFSAIPLNLLAALTYEADVILIEADGAAHMAAKAPEQWEPVVPYFTDETVIVMGLHAVGRKLEDVCHRKRKVMELLACDGGHIMTRKDLERLMEEGYERPLHHQYKDMAFRKIYNQKERI